MKKKFDNLWKVQAIATRDSIMMVQNDHHGMTFVFHFVISMAKTMIIV